MLRICTLACLGWIVLAGCDQQAADITPMQPPKAKSINDNSGGGKSSGGSKERLIGGLWFTIPSDWKEESSNAAIMADFRLPGDAGQARLTLSTAGGGTAANIDRWRDQFRRGPEDPEPKESSIIAAGKPATLIELHGSFTDMFGGGGSKPNWRLLGIAIPIDSDHNYFVKVTGPRETIESRRAEVLKFVETSKFE